MPKDGNCRYCRSPLPPKAAKCAACGSFQNWRRHGPLLTAFVFFLLGAAAVAGIFIEPLRDLVKPEAAITVERVRVTAEGYTVLLRNRGREPGVVSYVRAFYGKNYVELQGSIEDRVIHAGDSRAITMTLPSSFIEPRGVDVKFSRKDLDDEQPGECELLFVVLVGVENWLTIKEPNGCDDYAAFLTGEQGEG